MVVDPAVERDQVEALRERRARRDAQAVARALSIVSETAEGDANLLYPMKAALELGATVGEVTRALLPVFGRYRPSF
jgi:methylmalonyl-CoA mutase N-terminal domain/subunit